MFLMTPNALSSSRDGHERCVCSRLSDGTHWGCLTSGANIDLGGFSKACPGPECSEAVREQSLWDADSVGLGVHAVPQDRGHDLQSQGFPDIEHNLQVGQLAPRAVCALANAEQRALN